MKILKILGIAVGVIIVLMLIYSFVAPKPTTPAPPPSEDAEPQAGNGAPAFYSCVTPPASRQRYDQDKVSGDFVAKAKPLFERQFKGVYTQFELYDRVHGALKAFDVMVNKNSVAIMAGDIRKYMASSDARPWQEEAVGRLRCS